MRLVKNKKKESKMTLESTIRKMQVEEIDLDELIESLDEGLDEGRMKELHGYIAKGMSAEEIAKKMKLDVKTIQSLMDDTDLDERSAAAQARKDARGEFDDKPEKDDDDVATDADKKRGDENIINQLRKALDEPKHKIRFADGKSEVVKPDIVKAALKIFMKLKSNDKRKLQPMFAKSAKDLTKVVTKLMKKAHYEGVEEMKEDFAMGRFGVSHSLVDAVKDVIMGKRVNEKEGDKEAYQKFFQQALKKFGVSSPSELKGDKEKEFYDYVDKNWTGDHEESKKVNEVAKKAVKEADLDEFTVSDVEIAMKKKYGKVDKEAIEKLKKVQHMGNVDRNALVKVGHGKLHVESVELDENLKKAEKLMGPSKNRGQGIEFVMKGLKVSKKTATQMVDKILDMKEEVDDEDDKETAKKAKKDEPKKNGKEKVEIDPTLDEVKEEMTEAQKAKREEIVKELKKKTEDFKKKYGDRWEDVMYATATKMAMKAA